MARTDLEAAIAQRPANTAAEDWTPILQLEAGITKLRAVYQRSSVTDIDTVRRQLQNLTDELPGGFADYQREFQRLHAQLIACGVNNAVTADELREWAKRGIKNQTVFNIALSSWLLDNQQATYEQIFSRVALWLQQSPEHDPYKTVGTASGKTSAHAANFRQGAGGQQRDQGGWKGNNRRFGNRESPGGKPDTVVMCTRCWRTGHSWDKCRSDNCGACAQDFLLANCPTCPYWRSHANGSHRFNPNRVPVAIRKMEEEIAASKGTKGDSAKRQVALNLQETAAISAANTTAAKSASKKNRKRKRTAFAATEKDSEEA